jgi:hypothetical protein
MADCPPEPPNPPEIEALYPDGTVPEERFRRLPAVCSFGDSPILITGALCQTFQQLFADPLNIRSWIVRKMMEREGPWRADSDDAGIYIESIANWRPELTQSRPAIIIKGGDWTFARQGIGNQLGADVETGERFFAGFWSGSHTIFVIGKEGGETQAISGEVVKNLLHFSENIAAMLELHRFTVARWGGLAELEESPEHYVVPIDVAYVLEERWSTQIEAPRLKRIEFRPRQLGL